MVALTLGGGFLGARLGRAVSNGVGRLATFGARKLGVARPEMARPLAKGALAAAALTTTMLGPLVLRGAAVAGGLLLLAGPLIEA